ncbi:MAG: tyrosine-type recombinase/integrase [Chloroflexota bacterium]
MDVAPEGALREQRSKGGFATKAAALDAMHGLQSAVASGTHIEPSRRTVAAYLEEWLPAIRREVRGGTWTSYELHVRAYIVPHIGRLPLQQLTRAAVKSLYATLADSGRVRGGGLSPKAVHNTHLVLRKALADAVEDRVLAHNPADGAHRLPTGRPEMLTWAAEQLDAFLASVRPDRYFALWRLAAMTGMRRGEVIGLRWSDVDLEAGTLRVQQQRVRGADGLTYAPPKTAKGRRNIGLDPATVAAVRAHRVAQVQERIAFGPGYVDGGLVFARPDGSALDPDVVSQAFERHARRAGLPRIRLHDLRHTHATLALSAGIHPKVVQERLGHSSVALTLDVYSHAIPAMQADAADRIAALVDGVG